MLLLKIIAYGTEGLEDIQPNAFLQWLSLVGLIASLMGYYYICWRKQGQTLGMKAWRLRLQQADGNFATPRQCILRSFCSSLSLAFFGIGYLYCLLPQRRVCIQDILTRTQVVVIAK